MDGAESPETEPNATRPAVPQRPVWQVVVALASAAALLALLVFQLRAAESTGLDWILPALGFALVWGLLLYWLLRPSRVIRRLRTRHDLDAALEGTRDRTLATPLLWLEYALALDATRNGGPSAAPAEVVPQARAIGGRMLYAARGYTVTVSACYLFAAAVMAFITLSDFAVFGPVLAAAMTLVTASVVWSLWQIVKRHRSPDSARGRRILATRTLDAEARWAILVTIAREEIAEAGRCVRAG